jgi:hypothetical protein
MSSDFDPYHKWLGIGPAEQPPSHYRLLGVPEFESDPQVIDAAADRQLTFLRKQQMGPHQREANELLNEVTRARQVLVKPAAKIAYDATLADKPKSRKSNRNNADLTPRPVGASAIIGISAVGLVVAVIAGLLFFATRPSTTQVAAAAGASGLTANSGASNVSGNVAGSDAGAAATATRQPVDQELRTDSGQSQTPNLPQGQPAASPKPVLPPKAEIEEEPIAAPDLPADPEANRAPAGLEEYHLPQHVSVLPVAFISSDQQPPTAAETEKFLKHVKWAQTRYRELLGGDTFDIAQPNLKLLRGQKPLDFYRTPPDRGAPDIVSELLTDLKINRYQNPYIFCILLMNSKDSFPEGAGRPINGGLNTGGGMMYISSQQLEANQHFQATLQHELGHAFGLPHVDVYAFDMNTNASLMSYNPAHFTKGFEPSPTPAVLIPEDLRALALNKRVFAKATFVPKRDVPAIYPLAKRIVTLGPMTLRGQPDFYAKATTNGGEEAGSKIGYALSEEIFANIGPGLNFIPSTMWHSLHNLPRGSADVEITFPVPVRLSGISFHSKHSNMDHHIASVIVRTADKGTERQVVAKSLNKFDELVTFQPAISKKWQLNLTPGPSGTLVVRGMRFFDGGEEIFPHQVPYQNAAGVDDTRPGKQSMSNPALAQTNPPKAELANFKPNGPPALAQNNAGVQNKTEPAKPAATPTKIFSDPKDDKTPGKVPPAKTAETKPAVKQPAEVANAGDNTGGKAAIPDAKAQTEARKTVKEQFENEYAQTKKPAGKVALAIALIEKAAGIADANAVRYIMLSEALEFAAEAGDASVTQQALEDLEKLYDVRPFELKERALSAAVFTGKTYEDASLLMTQYANLAAEAAKAEDYATSMKAMLSAAKTLKNPLFKPLKDFATLEGKRYALHQDAYVIAKAARDKLAANPTDPAASLIWGRFLCFYLENWDEGLPLLVQSGDKVWKPIAERDIDKPMLADELFRLGDDWLKAGDKEKDPVQFQTRARAILAWEAAVQTANLGDRPKLQSQLDQRISKLFDKSIANTGGNPNGAPLIGTEGLNPKTDFTLEFWFDTTSKNGIVFSKHHVDADCTLRVRLSSPQADNPRLHLEIARGGGAGGSDTSNSFSDGHWHHMALVKQGAAINVYVDGQSVIKRTMQDGEQLVGGSPWKLGCGKGGPPLASQFAKVRISNVARYTQEFVPPKQYLRDFSTVYLR